MKRKIFLLAMVIISINLLAQQKHSTFYYQRTSLFEKLPSSTNDIILLGNSITNGGEWSELFGNTNVKNRGISGDICLGVYDRLDAITAKQPAKIFLLIGINDIGRGTAPDSVVMGIDRIIEKIQSQLPKTSIYLQSILPVNESFGMFDGHTKHWKEIKPLNTKLEALAKTKNIAYIDLYSEFVEPGTDKLNPLYTNDGLHLLGEGYMKWVEILTPLIERHTNIVEHNFDFASQQLSYALQVMDDAIQNDKRDNEVKLRNPLVSPRTLNKDGTLKMAPANEWTSGFFPGTLWYMYENTKDSKWEKLAREYTATVENQQLNKGTHDIGFMMYNSFGNGLRLTNDASYKPILMESAKSLISRYKPNAKTIRSWDHGAKNWQCPVIIDNMMNLELLFWAFKESGDSTFYTIAVNHANTTMKNHFRTDYSTYHVVDYDMETGQVLMKQQHQGFADESTWSRGQAWALYGFTTMYRETKDEAYLEQAHNITNFIFAHPNLPADLIPYWDYDAPNIPNEERDVSAATITASALYELSTYGGKSASKYKKWADTILQNLTNNYRATLNSDGGFLLLHSTGAKSLNSEIDVPLVYADYYFMEALLRKQKLESGEELF